LLSLKERIDLLEADLRADPPRINVYRDLPFAILRYDPEQEWELRRELRLLGARLEQANRRVHFVSLADLLWQAIDESEGMAAIVELERERGYEAAQEQVTIYLSDRDWRPLPELLAEKLRPLDPKRDVVFLIRAGAMAPAIYQMSRLLDEMQGLTAVTTILAYPGTIEGTTGLRFMDLPDRETMGNYRVKIYA
jgi:hypothetical protein